MSGKSREIEVGVLDLSIAGDEISMFDGSDWVGIRFPINEWVDVKRSINRLVAEYTVDKLKAVLNPNVDIVLFENGAFVAYQKDKAKDINIKVDAVQLLTKDEINSRDFNIQSEHDDFYIIGFEKKGLYAFVRKSVEVSEPVQAGIKGRYLMNLDKHNPKIAYPIN